MVVNDQITLLCSRISKRFCKRGVRVFIGAIAVSSNGDVHKVKWIAGSRIDQVHPVRILDGLVIDQNAAESFGAFPQSIVRSQVRTRSVFET